MNKNLVLDLIIVATLCSLGTLYFLSREATTTALFNLKDWAITKIQPAVNAWNNIPATYKAIIVAGIPTLFTIFFAWTKNRAMQKLQQTQTEAQTQATQLTGEINEAKQQVATLQTQKTNLEQQVASLTNQTGGISKLANGWDEAQKIVAQKQIEINSLRDQITALQNTIADLKMREKIVVR